MYWRERLQGQSGLNPGCSRTKQLGQDSGGEVRKDGIRGWDQNKIKNTQQDRGTHPDWQSVIVSSGEPAQDLFLKSKGWVS